MSLFAAIAILAGLLVLAGFLNSVHPAFDTVSHFRLHLAALLAVVALPMLLAKRWRLAGVAAICIVTLSVGLTLGLHQQSSLSAVAAAADPDPKYRLLQSNLRFNNPEPAKVVSLIDRLQPDIITFQEVSTHWKKELKPVADSYSHRIVCDRSSVLGGVAIYSHHPIAEDSPGCLYDGMLAIARISIDGQPVDVVALHLHWPWPYRQHRQVREIIADFSRLQAAALVAGDFNAAPWSQTTKSLAASGGLKSAGWVGPTWLKPSLPAFLRPLVGLPLDQILVKGGVAPVHVERMEMGGSDHLPVMMEFSL